MTDFGGLGLSPETIRRNHEALAKARARAFEPSAGPETLGLQLVGVVDDSLVKYVERTLASKPNAKEISAVIKSPGGYLDPARQIYGALRSHGAFIRTRAVHQCASAATTLLLAGDDREATADAVFLLHEIEVDPRDERWTAARHQDVAAKMRTLNKEAAEFYSRCTGYWSTKFEAEMKTEAPLSAQRAMAEFGLVHRIIS